MSTAVAMLPESTLSYDLLLKKSSDQCREQCTDEAWAADFADEASTVAPETPSSASVVESVSSVTPPTAKCTTIFRNVSHTNPEGKNEGVVAQMKDLIRQTRELSELAFDEDCLTEITKKTKWKLSLLATNDLTTLCGFAVTRVTNGALSIAKIAVPVEYRGLGFGKLLMEDAIKKAKKESNVHEVCLSSLSTAVTFYQRIGFKAMTGVKVKTDFEVVEGQVYMVKKLAARPRK